MHQFADFASILIIFLLFNFSSALDSAYGEKEVFDGCNFQGKESVNTGNVNCTQVSSPSLWNDDANKRCVKEYIRGCQLAKIEQWCHQGASDHLKDANRKCESPAQGYEYGIDFYALCCDVCSKGRQAYLGKQSCKRDLPPNTELPQLIVQAEFENCCADKVTKGLRSANDDSNNESAFEEGISACDEFGCEHFCQEVDYDRAVCSCRAGFRLNRDGRKCDDIDECSSALTNICGPNQNCTNLAGGYECVNALALETEMNRMLRSNLADEEVQQCKKTEYYDPYRNKCIESIDEYEKFCTDEKCDTSFRNLLDSTNKCKPGHRLNDEHSLCEDINECALNNTCPNDEICVNRVGSFTCLNSADSNVTITCETGLILNGKSCDDKDECLLFDDNKCTTDQICINLLGSYECRDKPKIDVPIINNSILESRYAAPVDQSPSSNQTTPVDENTLSNSTSSSLKENCEYGQEKDSNGNCQEIDQCVKNLGICGEHARCIHSFANYSCECEEGFEMTQFSETNSDANTIKQCVDIDECTSSTDSCLAERSTCKNLNGTYECECKEGYKQSEDKKTCVNIDECLNKDVHQCHHTCEDTPGSFVCKCYSDEYTLQSDNRTCVEKNLCEEGNKFCDGTCERLPGNSSNQSEYICKKCEAGLSFDDGKKKCISIDHCQNDTCALGETCIHLKNGTTTCVNLNCPADYEANSEEKICEKNSAINNNEPLAISKRVLILPLNFVQDGKTITIYRAKLPDQSDDIEFEIEVSNSHVGEYIVDESYFQLTKQKMSHNLFAARSIREKQNFLIKMNAIYKKRNLHTSFLYVFVV